MATRERTSPLQSIQRRVTACRRCPRLVGYLGDLKAQHPEWWCRPVPSFGDSEGRILVIGLAPGRAGSNRTGRMFTGDGSGAFLYPVLHELGLASQPTATSIRDGMSLNNLYITAVGRCAPPQNKPTPEEVRRCSAFVAEELAALPHVRVLVTLGKIAHDATLKLLGQRPSAHPFRHGAEYAVAAPVGRQLRLLATYHPSRQNTQTGKLTADMFRRIFARAIELADRESPPPRAAVPRPARRLMRKAA